MIGTSRTCRRAMRGVAAIEFALLMIPVVLLMLGTMELGRAVMTYQLMSRSVRDGVRHASFASASNVSLVRAEAACLAYSGGYSTVIDAGVPVTTCEGNPVAPDLTLDMVQVCDWDRETAEPAACTGMRTDDPDLGAVYLASVSVKGYSYRGIFLDQIAGRLVPFGDITAVMRVAP